MVDATHATSITAMYDRLEFADGRVQHGFGHYDEDVRARRGRVAHRAHDAAALRIVAGS